MIHSYLACSQCSTDDRASTATHADSYSQGTRPMSPQSGHHPHIVSCALGTSLEVLSCGGGNKRNSCHSLDFGTLFMSAPCMLQCLSFWSGQLPVEEQSMYRLLHKASVSNILHLDRREHAPRSRPTPKRLGLSNPRNSKANKNRRRYCNTDL